MYHAIGSVVPEDRKGYYNIPAPRLEEQMKMLAELPGLQPLSLEHIDQDVYQGDVVGITFDDGYRDNLYTAAPILYKYQIPFTVFVVTDPVKSGDPLFLAPADIRRLVDDYQATIGSHGATHARLADCGKQRLKEELTASKKYLEDLLGREIDTISYPHGSVDQRVCDAAGEAGYRLGFTSYFGINSVDSDRLALARIPVLNPDNNHTLKQKIKGDWDWYRWLQRI
jgi:peptidoglycan/xylan/chitin deacetylase (PgdA/CDA1 family)